MERENQRIMLTKRLLQESLLRLLEKQELEKISVAELCREAGINRATFYRHYEIPRDVLNEIAKAFFWQIQKKVQLPHTRVQLREAIEQLCTLMEKNMDMIRLLIKNSSESDFTAFITELYQEVWDNIRSLKLLSNLEDEDVQMLILYSAGGSYFILRQWLLGNVRKNAKEMSDYLFRLLNRTDWIDVCVNLGLLDQ